MKTILVVPSDNKITYQSLTHPQQALFVLQEALFLLPGAFILETRKTIVGCCLIAGDNGWK
jgi:hypothetical protein